MGSVLTKDEAVGLFGEWSYQHEYAGDQFRYERRQVEMILVAYWNGGVIDDELQPEQGMPRAKANPSRMGNGPVYMLDIARALRRSDLTPKTREAIHLHYGQGMTQTQVADYLGITQQSARERIDLGVSKLTLHLNGER